MGEVNHRMLEAPLGPSSGVRPKLYTDTLANPYWLKARPPNGLASDEE
jgi:hypothetical protein